MKQRGRKSSAELAVVSGRDGQVTEAARPPDHFDDDQAELWANILGSKSADWWDPGTLPLLEAYVNTVTEYRRVSQILEGCHPIGDGFEFEQYDKIQKTQDRLASQLARLATKMRLSQQSKYGARGADGANGQPPGLKKPWQ